MLVLLLFAVLPLVGQTTTGDITIGNSDGVFYWDDDTYTTTATVDVGYLYSRDRYERGAVNWESGQRVLIWNEVEENGCCGSDWTCLSVNGPCYGDVEHRANVDSIEAAYAVLNDRQVDPEMVVGLFEVSRLSLKHERHVETKVVTETIEKVTWGWGE